MDWLFVLFGAVIFFGPIVWALTVGRTSGVPDEEDAKGRTAFGSFIAKIVSGGRRGG
jgi:hypothetical protein